jgi:cell division protein FtsI/penicillin-binding protein 2
LNNWNKLSITRVPMGHEVAVTPMQMVMMLSAVANKGKLMRPMLLDSLRDQKDRVVVNYHPESIRQVVSPDTARKVTEALKTVVGEGGTARRAKLEYYSVAGKTGTAQKPGRGGYIPGKFYSSFVGFFPADKPALCIFVGLDEPTGDYYGGLTAAPIFKTIAERTASYFGIKPDLVEQ